MDRTGWIILALVLIVLGVGSFLLEGISYIDRETVLDAGPVEVTAEERQRIGIPIWLSAVLAGGGVVALAVGLKKPSRR